MPVADAAKRDYRAVLLTAIASLLSAALAFAFIGVQVADAGEGGGAQGASHGKKKHSKSSKNQLRELRRMVRSQAAGLEALRGELAALRGQSGAPATPTGAAGGDLTGAYPSPTLADGSIDSTDLFSASLLDGAASTPSLRTLGTGANQALPGDATPGGPPTGVAGGALAGAYPDPAIAADAVGASELGGIELRQSNIHEVPDGTAQGLSLACQPGETLLSGGFDLVDVNGAPVLGGADILFARSQPNSAGAWGVRIVNFSGGTGTVYYRGSVLCLEP